MFQRALSLMAVTSLTLFASAAKADKPVDLKFRMKKDDRLIYRMTTTLDKSRSVMDRKQRIKIGSSTIYVLTVNKIDGKGNVHFDVEIKRIKMDAEFKPGGEYKYDSTSTDNEKASGLGMLFTPILDTLNGASFKVTVTPRGKVLPVKGYDELLAEVLKDNPLKGEHSSAAFTARIGMLFVRSTGKPIKPSDKWEHKDEVKLPGLGTAKGAERFTYAGPGKVGSRKTGKITVTGEGALDIETTQGGMKITGTLTTSEATGVIHFDPKAGCVVSKTITSRQTGTLNVEAGDKNIPLMDEQTTNLKIELLEKLPN